MPTMFLVKGPLEVPYRRGKGGRTITPDNVKAFWQKHGHLGSERGCYVFAIRAGKGLRPAYVGKATRSFRQEAFAHHKLTRYQQAMADYQKGTPVLFFLVAPCKKGACNTAHVDQLERFLIQVGLAANPGLLNVKGTKAEEWGIAGVLRGGKGKPSVNARHLRRCMKLQA